MLRQADLVSRALKQGAQQPLLHVFLVRDIRDENPVRENREKEPAQHPPQSVRQLVPRIQDNVLPLKKKKQTKQANRTNKQNDSIGKWQEAAHHTQTGVSAYTRETNEADREAEAGKVSIHQPYDTYAFTMLLMLCITVQ